MSTADMDSLLHKSSFAKSNQKRYKAEVHSSRLNNSNVSGNDKKYIKVLHKEFSKNDVTIKEVVLHKKYTERELVYQTMCGKLKIILGTDPVLN